MLRWDPQSELSERLPFKPTEEVNDEGIAHGTANFTRGGLAAAHPEGSVYLGVLE